MYHYLQEWNEACAYAAECLPPFVYEINGETVWFMIFTIAVCYGIYLKNEYDISKARAKLETENDYETEENKG